MPNLTKTASAPRRSSHVYPVQVSRVTELTPHMTRISVTGPGLGEYADDGPDQRCKLFLPRPGHDRPVIPAGPDWFAALREMPEQDRPVIRTYTVRRIRREAGEADIDFALHGEAGPATAWASSARPGDQAMITAARAEYSPPPSTDWLLLAGDETALPAIGAILDRRPASLPARVWIEVADAGEPQRLRGGDGVAVTWLYRDGAAAGGTLLADALRSAQFPAGTPYAWAAGETSAVRAIRGHLIGERGLPLDSAYLGGYWKLGASIEEDRRRGARTAAA